MTRNRSLLLAISFAFALAGCNRSQPEVAAPQPSDQPPPAADSTTAPEPAPSDEKPDARDINEPSAATTPSANEGPATLRDLAARLIESDSLGGWRISESAALELEKLGPTATDELWALLGDKSAETRRGAAFYLLGQFNPNRPEQVEAFLALLQDPDSLVRGIALEAAQQMREPDLAASQALLTQSLDPSLTADPNRRAAIARVLQRLKSKAAESAPALSNAVANDPDAKVRGAALVALSNVAPADEVVATAQKALADSDPAVRIVAAARLRQLGKPAAPAAAALAKALSDSDERVRSAAAEALVRLGADAVPALIDAVDAESTAARQLAVACLSRIGPPAKDALPSLEKRKQDPDETVRKLAAVAIGKITQGQPAPSDAR
jgi:HEAT repeat protein